MTEFEQRCLLELTVMRMSGEGSNGDILKWTQEKIREALDEVWDAMDDRYGYIAEAKRLRGIPDKPE